MDYTVHGGPKELDTTEWLTLSLYNEKYIPPQKFQVLNFYIFPQIHVNMIGHWRKWSVSQTIIFHIWLLAFFSIFSLNPHI